MTTVLLLRHGQTTADAEEIIAGWLPDVHLDEIGVEQGTNAAKRLAEVRYSTLLTSPIEACRETSAMVSAKRRKDLPTNTEVDLADCRFGDWTGLPEDVVAKESLWEVSKQHPSAVQFPGGESLPDMQARSIRAIRKWNRRLGPNATYVAVTHSYVIRALLADALGMHLDHFNRIEVEPGSVSVIKYFADNSVVSRMNDAGGDLSVFSPPRRRRAARRSK